MTDTNVELISNRKPRLSAGQYSLTVEQTVSDGSGTLETFKNTKTFIVAGKRYQLAPGDIHSVYPPNNSAADYSRDLPYCVLNSSTLPWERSTDGKIPWLALLVVHEDELAQVVESVGSFDKSPQMAVIDVAKPLAGKLIPNSQDMGFLAHVRKTGNEQKSVIMANRLVQLGKSNKVYLVSLENHFTKPDIDTVRLVYFKSWQFHCNGCSADLAAKLNQLDQTNSTLRLPIVDDKSVEQFYRQGFVPLPHHLQHGDKTVSWYHGPLAAGVDVGTLTEKLPILTGDKLIQFFEAQGLLDMSYSAAWELGRLLALQNKAFSSKLYHWKLNHRHYELAQKQANDGPSLVQPVDADATLPEELSDWLQGLRLLKEVPFVYLVAKESMLPVNSIRFFCIDNHWRNALLDGAFSIGRTSQRMQHFDSEHHKGLEVLNCKDQIISGFILRSALVADYPDLLVNGYNKSNNALSIVRQDKLSPNVMLCLFEGEIQTVDFALKPQAAHFGFAVQTPVDTLYWDAGKTVLNVTALAKTLGGCSDSKSFALNMLQSGSGLRFGQGVTVVEPPRQPVKAEPERVEPVKTQPVKETKVEEPADVEKTGKSVILPNPINISWFKGED